MSSQSVNSVEAFIQQGLYLRNWSQNTARCYRFALKDLPETITKSSLDGWVIGHRQTERTPAGTNIRIRSLNSYLAWLRSEGESVPPPLKLLRVPKTIVQTLSDTEIKALIAQKNSRTKSLTMVLLDCGLRIEEALTLERGKVDLDQMLLTVRGKGSKERIIPFSLELRKALFRHLSAKKLPNSRFVFCTRRGGRLAYRNAARDIKNLCEAAGITREIHVHSLRHTFAATFIKRGGSIFALGKLLGHSSVTTTELYCRSLGVSDFKQDQARFSPLSA